MKHNDRFSILCDGVEVQGGLHLVPVNGLEVRIFSPYTGMKKSVSLPYFEDLDSVDAQEYINSIAQSSLLYLYLLGKKLEDK